MDQGEAEKGVDPISGVRGDEHSRMQGVDESQELQQLAAGFVGKWAGGLLWSGREEFAGNMVGRNSQDGVHQQPLGRGPSSSAYSPRVCPRAPQATCLPYRP